MEVLKLTPLCVKVFFLNLFDLLFFKFPTHEMGDIDDDDQSIYSFI